MPLVRDSQCLAPENSTALELALERLTRRLEDVPVPLRDLWRPDTCPIELLPWLAYALSIDSWNPTWSESVKRNVVAAAIEIQRKKGTAASVRQVVAAFGGQIALREWWQLDPPGEPYTFDLVLTLNGEGGQPATARFVTQYLPTAVASRVNRACSPSSPWSKPRARRRARAVAASLSSARSARTFCISGCSARRRPNTSRCAVWWRASATARRSVAALPSAQSSRVPPVLLTVTVGAGSGGVDFPVPW